MYFQRYFICITMIVCAFSAFSFAAQNLKAVAVSGGEEHSLVVAENGWVFSAGDNSLGQLGRTGVSTTFQRVLAGEMNTTSGFLENIIGVGSGWIHALAVDAAGSVWSWGNDDRGELGNGVEGPNSVPVHVHGGEQGTEFLSYITQVAAGLWQKQLSAAAL
jgi:alpha-tubulin suppressor-like RCC1 family protein